MPRNLKLQRENLFNPSPACPEDATDQAERKRNVYASGDDSVRFNDLVDLRLVSPKGFIIDFEIIIFANEIESEIENIMVGTHIFAERKIDGNVRCSFCESTIFDITDNRQQCGRILLRATLIF